FKRSTRQICLGEVAALDVCVSKTATLEIGAAEVRGDDTAFKACLRQDSIRKIMIAVIQVERGKQALSIRITSKNRTGVLMIVQLMGESSCWRIVGSSRAKRPLLHKA